MDTQERNHRMQLGAGEVVETALRWGLPASPLFLMILMLLAHAPYAAPIVEAALFYLACMGGALVGLTALCRLRLGGRRSQACCIAGGVALQASWLVLLAAERAFSAPLLLAGSALAGLGSAALLVLWLAAGQTDCLACELGKLAVAFGTAYVLYTLFSVIPHGGAVSYLFPPLICAALLRLLAREKGEEATEGRAALPRPRIAQCAAMACLLACFGAGFAALGFGGAQVEQGAGLIAVVLAGCTFARCAGSEPLRLIAVPAVVFSLCYAGLAGAGNAFAFFLMGCGSLVIWLYLQHRFGHGAPYRTSTREIAVRLTFIALSAGAGMALGHTAFSAAALDTTGRTLALVAATALVWIVWQLADMCAGNLAEPAAWAETTRSETDFLASPTPQPAVGASPEQAPAAPGASQLDRLYALSPRETQVAQLLCQNRSVRYISRALGMADSTAKTHVRHVYEKAGVHSRSEFQLETERLSKVGQP